MKLCRYYIRNFRRLEDVEITLEDSDTNFVGPNNSAKTSATAAFQLFVAQSADLRIHDFSSPLMPFSMLIKSALKVEPPLHSLPWRLTSGSRSTRTPNAARR